ncbi:SDR family oxidoreductase [Xanthobacteraceae bacterium Astr-EGSB]|uniref:SDR family NAD(P)-dependent oxidoreductase n=1 Tax=Astrobacterium formosum TaxID=3069710 RepID=UPI0027B36692|nr:SDR family oxidoreductase [Xanthobacteraceae bacterium Astr-EGSB]
MRLKDKVALITGAAQGLGAAMATRFAQEGATVFVCDLNTEAGEATAAKIRNSGGKSTFHKLDVACEADWIAVYAAVVAACGRLDVLVNNAGINIRELIEVMAEANFDKMLAVNVKGPFLGIKHAIPLMRKGGGGSIINMSSVCGLVGHRYTPEAYTITKGAVTLMTKTIGVRYAKDNIRCNSIHPSTVDTPLVQILFQDPKRKEERLGEVPLGRLATDLDVANAALYLASDEAAFLNGVSLPVDGGVTAY